jgi:hypothetical protein
LRERVRKRVAESDVTPTLALPLSGGGDFLSCQKVNPIIRVK